MLADDDDDVQPHALAVHNSADRLRMRQEAIKKFIPGNVWVRTVLDSESALHSHCITSKMKRKIKKSDCGYFQGSRVLFVVTLLPESTMGLPVATDAKRFFEE